MVLMTHDLCLLLHDIFKCSMVTQGRVVVTLMVQNM